MEIELIADQAAERLDRWLGTQLSNISRSRVQKLIEQGNMSLNGEICRNKKIKIHCGDRIALKIPPAQPLNLTPEAIPLDILYEDEYLLIVNKPANLVVHPSPGHTSGTLVHALLAHCTDLAGIGGIERPGIVHRLDKDTTGAIMMAKTDFAHQQLQAQLKAKTAYREYWGVVYGCPKDESGKIDEPIGRNPLQRQKMAVVVPEKGGKEAVTHWRILERLGNYTLMEFRLETGRTHQIRVHVSHIGHPIVGDPLYGAGKSVKVNLTGQALHARRLRLIHPVSQEILDVTAPLPDEFAKLLSVLRQRT